MDTKDAYIKQLENTILSLQKQVDNLTEMILLLRKEKFGSSSEKTPKSQIDGQLSLFNEAELEVSSECDEPIVRDVKGYTRKATRTTRAELIKDLPVREIPCDIPEEEMFCGQCHVSKVCEQRAFISPGKRLGELRPCIIKSHHGSLDDTLFRGLLSTGNRVLAEVFGFQRSASLR